MRHSKQEKPRTQEVIKRWKIGLAALVFYQISAFALTILAVRFKLDWLVSIESLPGGGQALEFTPLTILIPLALTLIVYAAATHYFRGRLSAIQWYNKENYRPIEKKLFIKLVIRYSLGLIIVANLIEFLVLRILQPPHTQGVVTTFITQNPAIGLFLACIIAPIWEESFFRGFVLRRLFERFGYWWSSVLTAVIFALAHTEVISAVSIAYLLIVLGGASLFINHIFLRHRNLLLNIVVHSLLNFSSFVMLLVLK